jgi:hypothetical protein
MKPAIFLCSSLLALAPACRRQASPAPARSAAPPPSAISTSSSPGAQRAVSPALALQSEHERSGLRVQSGTIAGGTSSSGELWGFTQLDLDLQRVALSIVAEPRGVALPRLLSGSALAVLNGGYFEPDFRPSAWLRDKGVDRAPKLATTKGGALAVAGERVFVGPLALLGFEPELAIQSFPLIVELDGSAGIRTDDGKRAARTVACSANGRLRFVIIAAPRGSGPTLFESVSLLRAAPPTGFGCDVALNLDGGPSSGVWFAASLPAKNRLPLAPVGYAIAISPR